MTEYVPFGAEFIVNTITSANQTRPTVTYLANGGFVVIWQTNDTTQDGSSSALKGQIFDASGTKVGSEFLVNTATAGGQQNADVTVLANGNFVVTWDSSDPLQDGSGFAVKAQLYSGTGVKIGSEFLVNTSASGDQSVAEVAALANGGFVITWSSFGGDFDQFAQVFDAQGTKVGSEFKVNAASVGLEDSGEVVGLANGSFLVTWRTSLPLDGNLSSIMGRLFNADGTPIGAQFVINTQATGGQTAPTATALENGNFVVAWFTDDVSQDGSSGAIKAQLFAANGTKIGGEFLVNTQTSGAQSEARVSNLPGGGFIVTWRTGDTSQDGSGAALKAQVFDAAGVKVGGEFLVNQWTSGDQTLAAISTLASGDVVITWTSVGADGSGSAIGGRIFAPVAPTTIISNGGGDTAAITVDENSLSVTTVAATSGGGTITYSITGGADAALFAIDAASGALSFITAPDFEAPGDAGGNNVYDVVVSASDGTASDSQAISITVSSGNDAPAFQGSAELTVGENSLIAGTVAATDPDGDPLTYSIVGGVDAARFTINAQTGTLTFVNAPNYEQPLDANGDNVFNITVAVSDGTLSESRALSIVVANLDEAPTFVSSNNVIMPENYAVSYQVQAVDPDSPTTALSYAITGGADASLFTIDSVTGHLNFLATPDFEAPGDAGSNNVYNVTVSVTDGNSFVYQSIMFQIYNANETPSITSSPAFAASENALVVGTITASDPDGTTPSFAIVGGADAARFVIDTASGELSFIAAPDYEVPGDADGNNVYEVTVQASDGSLTSVQAVSVTLGNVNEAPDITSQVLFTAAENGTAVGNVAASDVDSTTITYAISGGADAARFAIDAATGALSFVAAPDFEAPSDVGGDNIYDVIVSASDGSLSTSQALAVVVGNVNEAPTITSGGGAETFAVVRTEGASTAVTTLAATDPDGTPLTYAIAGGADASRFTINAATGLLSFVASPNFEAPTDSNGDNVYQVIVSASDGSLGDSQTISVTITNVNENLAITSNGGGDTASITINENTTAVTTVAALDQDGTAPTYAITGGADASRFTINAVTGALSFVAAPNFEAPTDSNGDNVYQVEVRASDGTYGDYQMISITVANVVDGLTLTGTSKANSLTGGSAEDTINGLAGNDTLSGLGGADTINGGDGADTIIGGAGGDTLIGGLGADTFVYQALAESSQAISDFLTDFSTSQGDKISLSAIDANANLAGDQAFSWIGTGAFSNVAGQLRYYQSGGDTFVTGDVNGDGVGDFSIRIDPLVTLAATNFVL